jgi:hypothetical protein
MLESLEAGALLNLAMPIEWVRDSPRCPGGATIPRLAAYFARRWELELANPRPGHLPATNGMTVYREADIIEFPRWSGCPDCRGMKPLSLNWATCWCDLS